MIGFVWLYPKLYEYETEDIDEYQQECNLIGPLPYFIAPQLFLLVPLSNRVQKFIVRVFLFPFTLSQHRLLVTQIIIHLHLIFQQLSVSVHVLFTPVRLVLQQITYLLLTLKSVFNQILILTFQFRCLLSKFQILLVFYFHLSTQLLYYIVTCPLVKKT